MRHPPGLESSPPGGYKLEVERSGNGLSLPVWLAASRWRAWSEPSAPGRDQPCTRIEDHAVLVAAVRRERLAQALNGTSRLAVAQGRKGRAGVLKPPDE